MAGGYGTGPFGTGPYGTLGGVWVFPPHPVGGGYGGSAYGYSPYGTITTRPPFPVSGGYGGSPYGTGPYGTVDTTFPSITSAVSLDGFRIEVFFDEEMLIDSALVDPLSYTLTPTLGAPSTALSVVVGVTGTWGATSVIVTHTGTTLGGDYTIAVNGPSDLAGNPISGNFPLNTTTLLTKGEPPAYTITPVDGDEILFQFDTDMLTEAEFTPGIEEFAAYQFTTTYPVPLTILNITHPNAGDASQVLMQVQGQTSASYTCNISPADAIIYDGTILPSAATTFTGTENGTGTSTPTALGLLMTSTTTAYGWEFADTSGKLIPGSSYRMDLTFDVSAAVIAPPLFDTVFAQVKVSDGAIEFIISIERIAGVDTFSIVSGAYSASFAAAWSTTQTTLTVVRNQKAGIFSFIVNGQPFETVIVGTPSGAPTISNGVEFLQDPGGSYTITQLPLQLVEFTSTQTVFSTAWNFLHGQTTSFTGSDEFTNDTILTDCGPLVKDWGDATPATEQDVTVEVNGVEVEVADVNPYVGKIFPAIPIPLMPPGTMTVEVDYCWWKAPVFEFAGLNCEGQVLNKYELFNDATSPRFAFGLVLGPLDDLDDNGRKPQWIGHRYIGYEQAYSALLNSPTTMLLNEPHHSVSRPFLTDAPEPVSVTLLFSNLLDPTQQDPPWALTGVDSGGFEGITPLYNLKDESSGSFGQGTAAVYTQEVDLSQPTSFLMSAWFFTDSDTVTYDGVFSGAAFGVHDNDNLYLVGALLINDVQHVGMLIDPGFPEKAESWELAYQASIVILDNRRFSVSQDALPERSFAATSSGIPLKLQIFEGSQVGVYEAEDVVLQSDGTATVTITTTFPANPTLFGNRDAVAVFESKWDGTGLTKNLTIYRLVVASDRKNRPDGFAQLFIGSSLTGKALELSGGVPKLAIPPDSTLLLPTGEKGLVFWGSLSRKATNDSSWSFVIYSATPDQTMFHALGIVAAAEMNDLPDEDPNNIWFLTQRFGQNFIDTTADQLVLKSTAAADQSGVENTDLTIGYARVEPFLVREHNVDLDAVFRVESGVLGAGDVEINIFDTERRVRFATLLYEEILTNPPETRRQLVSMPSISLSGLLTPEAQGWDLVDPGPEGPPTADVQGQIITFTKITDQRIRFEENFDPLNLPGDGRILEARIKFDSATTTDPGGNTNIFIGCDAGDVALPRSIGMRFRKPEGGNPARVAMFSPETGMVVSIHDFDWEDGLFHTYRILIDPATDAVTLVIDDSVIGTDMFTLYDASPTQTRAQIGFVGADVNAVMQMEDFSVVITPPDTVKRTLGVWLGGEDTDINSWELPRTDALTVPNSHEDAVIEEMDWREFIQIRLHRDPTWGITVLRPDLPPPPFFTGNFATEITEPSAGWINVEYRLLPRDRCPLGFISFGALNPLTVTQQRWRDVRYRIYPQANEEFIPLPHAVLNQQNVITSGEFEDDLTIETLIVQSADKVTIKLRQTNITADRVFNLLFDDENGQQQIINPDFFSFDFDTQIVTIDSEALADAGSSFTELPADHTPVTVNFAAGKPITKTYLENQPFLDSKTLLNEGTPPVPKSQQCPVVRQVAFGSRINDPNDLLNTDPDFILNDPFRYVEFEDELSCMYDCMEFCPADDGGETGLISTLCDDPVKGSGLVGFDLSGTVFQEYGEQGLGLKDPPNAANGACILDLTGPTLIGGILNECILQPLSPTGGGLPMDAEGNVIWPVIGKLVNPATGAVQVLWFDRQAPPP